MRIAALQRRRLASTCGRVVCLTRSDRIRAAMTPSGNDTNSRRLKKEFAEVLQLAINAVFGRRREGVVLVRTSRISTTFMI